jgi:hypothetical protein
VRYFEIHLGDGAYCYLSPAGDVVLYTSNGLEETNTVVLDGIHTTGALSKFEEWLSMMRIEVEADRLRPLA